MEKNQDGGEFIARDFVYIGRYMGKQEKEPHVVIRVIQEDGSLAEPLFYSLAKKMSRFMVGGVYTGATFGENQARGLAEAQFKKQWPDREARIEWSANDDLVEVRLRSMRMEKDAARISDLEQMMLPLRKQYESYRSRHDWAGMEALERAVLRALKSAPRVIEKD